MRWFTRSSHDLDDDDWNQLCAEYLAHLGVIGPRLPADLVALAKDQRLNLHDGRFRDVAIDPEAARVEMTIERGDLQLSLKFGKAAIVPADLLRLAEAIGAEFRPNHWHKHRTVTGILAQEVDLLPDGRFTLRLLLWPFYECAVEFALFSLVETPLPAGGPARAGRFVVPQRPRRRGAQTPAN